MDTTVERIQELVAAGRVEEAEHALDDLGGSEAGAPELHYCKGMVYERLCRWPEAAAEYEAAAAQGQGHRESAFRLAVLSDRFGDDDRAIEIYEGMTREAPSNVNALLNLAILYEDRERYDEALACVQRVLKEHPGHERARRFHKDIAASKEMYYDEEGERYREQRDALLETPISDFELSVRSRNCLKQMNIHSLGDLLKTTQAELLAYKNFGETSLHEIEAMLSQKNLRIGQLLEEKEGGLITAIMPHSEEATKSGVLNRSVAELELSVRSRKCLMRLGISSIGDLTQRTESELLAIKNFGMTSLSEIKRRLAELSLSLRGD